MTSPRITHISWGRMEVEGLPAGKDFMLYPGGGQEWDWTPSGTRHDPGIQASDVSVLLDRGATVVVLSMGIQERLGVDPATLRLLEDRGITVHRAETSRAVEIYNSLAGTEAVGGLFHSTC